MSLTDPLRHSTRSFWRIGLILLVLLAALFYRTYRLDRVPPGLDGDEMFNGWDAQRVWEGRLEIYYPTNYGSEPMLIYLIAVATRLLGVSSWSIRLAPVLCGMVGVLFTWSLARRLFSSRVGILGAGLMAVSLWPVFVSRVALRAICLPMCQAIGMYALWRALDERNTRWAIAAGLFMGLTLYTYNPGRAFPLVWALWPLIALIIGRRLPCDNARHLALAVIVAALVFLPLGVYALQNPRMFNQRMHELDSELKQLLVGDLDPFWRSLKAALGMFTQAGDEVWRYNPSGRPVFDKLTGGFFYLGVIVSLLRLRRPAYLLLLVWLPVMLLPTILATGTPSFWHSVGAMIPIYLMPAIGADFVWDRIVSWSRGFDPLGVTGRFVLPSLTLVGVVLIGADTWHDYFEEWPRHPSVLHTYEADMAAAARYLDTEVPDGTPVWVSSEYPGDLGRVLLGLQTTYSGPVRWFDGNTTAVWPSGWASQDVLLVFTQSSPPNPDALGVLSDYLILQENDAAGQPHLWVYRIPGEALLDVPWHFAHTKSGRFVSNRQILGYDIPEQVHRQTDVPVVVYWRVPAGVEYDVADLPFSYVCLRDSAAGRCLKKESHYQTYPVWDWTEGDVVAQRYLVPVPAYMPPQETDFQIGMFTGVGEISFADENAAGAPLLVGPVEVSGTAVVAPKWMDDTPAFNRELALLDSRLPRELWPGGTLEVDLRWQAMQPPSTDYVMRLELRTRTTGEVAISTEELLGSDRHPTSRWVGGEPVRVFPKMRIPPDLESGKFEVYLALLEGRGRPMIGAPVFLGTVPVSGHARSFELPAPEHPLTAEFGSSIRLLGFDLSQTTSTPGGQIEVVLYWQAVGVPSDDFKVFVHLHHPTVAGALSGQHDGMPGNDEFPTSSWITGEVVTDPHVVEIVPDAARGVSRIGVGLYIPSSGERLSARAAGKATVVDNALIISEVDID